MATLTEKELIKWAQSEESIEALVLVGSRGTCQRVDTLSDYDLAVFCNSSEPYIKSDRWISHIAKVWVWVPESFMCEETLIPTRLVIFEGGAKVDFAFYPLEMLQKASQERKLPQGFDHGYTILLDQKNLTKNMPQPSGTAPQIPLPSDKEFTDLVREFWFEIYHVAKYIKRRDLWSVKFRMGGIYDHYLIKMICWNEVSKGKATHSLGKHLSLWADPKILKALDNVFGHFDAADSQKALFATIDLFRDLSKETASNLSLTYPSETDQSLTQFTQDLLKAQWVLKTL